MHLAPDRHSDLPAIISRWTTMPVVQVGDDDRKPLASDHVYVIAPDRQLEITDSSIASAPFEQRGGQRTAIDLFFRSLAAMHGDGFAVVLSGSGSDGAIGAKAVKERGGLVLVQDPHEAAHSGMPCAAIDTGAADVVLPIGDLVARLAALVRNKQQIVPVVRAAETAAPISGDEDAALKKVLDVLRARTGHDFSGYKRSALLRRVSRRLQLTDQLTIAGYLTLLRASTGEVQALFDDLLISVPTFFRNPEVWSAVQNAVIGPLVALATPDDQLRVWVPACATGEEAYTLAMLFHEEFERQNVSPDLVIFASDVDESALAVAREGLYPRVISADISDERLERFFRSEGDHYRIIRDLRDDVVFAAHSLLRDPPFSRLHLISCRNVLIDLDRDLQGRVMRVFRYACRDTGFLLLGISENAHEQLFQAVDQEHRVFRSRPGAESRLEEIPSVTSGRADQTATTESHARAVFMPAPAELHISALEDIAPPTVLVDERWNVLHLSSSAARFFQQRGGPLARRLTDLVRPELRDELLIALETALARSDAHLSAFVRVEFDGVMRRIAVLAQQRVRPRSIDRNVLVTFLDAGETGRAESRQEQTARGAAASLRDKLHHAEQRIENIRDDHFVTTQDLRAANEELQSLNEEYRSTTEELETSKEELQSTNEELQTINAELKVRLDEVSRAHSDVENLMAATNVATLFLDMDLRIKRYTRRLADIFNIRARDLDRPIGDLRHTLEYEMLEDDARRVLATLSPIERHVTSHGGRLYVARLSPYRTASDHRVDGVVVTFIDVTEIKQAEAAVRASERELESELQIIRRLHAMTLSVAMAPTIQDALDHVIAAAVELHGAGKGHVQLFDRDRRHLRIVAHRGFAQDFIERFATVPPDDPSSAGRAFRSGELVQIADVARDDMFAPLREAALEAGYRAVQSVPLINRQGELLGMLSIHFPDVHEFTERDLQLSALLGRQAADLLDSRVRQMEAAASKVETSQVRELLGRLVQVQEEERRRISRDIHDQMGQQMTALRMQIESLRSKCERSPDLAAHVGRIDHLAEELDQSVDFLTWELRPAALDRLGLSDALADVVRGWSAQFHVAAEYHASAVADVPLAADAAVNLYRIVQEALHNVHKHAQASRATVLLDVHGEHLTLVIEDNGRGFAQGEPAERGAESLGLISMRERARLIGGDIDIETAPGQGTSIFVRVPLARPSLNASDVAGS